MGRVKKSRADGFTLAELLIALAILGVIATFTIPKVLSSQQNAKFNAIAKESVAMVSGAFDAYKMQNTVTATTSMASLQPFMNYTRFLPNGAQIDGEAGNSPDTCEGENDVYPCVQLHNGAVIRYRAQNGGFGNSGAPQLRVIWYQLDPDGASVNHPTNGQSITFFLSQSGHIRDQSNVLLGSSSESSAFGPNPGPTWFNW